MKIDASAKHLVKLISEFPNLTLDRVERNRHFKLFLNTPTGRRILVCSVTASDGRAVQNIRSTLKRWARGE